MGSSYDAQRNEFCAYVLHESETPYGLLLGNYQDLRAVDRQGRRARSLGRRHRSDHLRHASHRLSRSGRSRDVLPASDRTRAHVSAVRADLRVHARRIALHVTEAFYVPHGPAFERAVSFVVDVTLYNPGRHGDRRRGLSLGDARRPALLRRTRTRGARLERRPLHLLAERRDRRRALVGRIARAGRGRALAARTGAARIDAPRDAGQGRIRADRRRRDAEGGRAREPAHLRRASSTRITVAAGRARVAAPGGRLSTRTATDDEPPVARSAARRPTRAARHAALFCATPRRRALPHALAGDQPRRRVGESEHAARRQGVSARLGFDELAAVGHPGLARHVVVRPRLRLLLAGVQPQRARGVQPGRRRQRA